MFRMSCLGFIVCIVALFAAGCSSDGSTSASPTASSVRVTPVAAYSIPAAISDTIARIADGCSDQSTRVTVERVSYGQADSGDVVASVDLRASGKRNTTQSEELSFSFQEGLWRLQGSPACP